jgi:ABC-type transport system involved in multi-copper enzyme maturation permease subunit
MGKGRPFLEVFTCALKEDYRFPILEVFAFFFALGTFVFADLAAYARNGETFAHSLVSTLWGFPLFFIFVVLILKNVAYGLGSDLDRGVIQTLFSYPLKRRRILTAKLLSALGVALLLFLGIQIFGLFLLARDTIATYSGTVFLTCAANLCSPALLLAGLVLLLTLLLKRGGLALIFGVVLYLAFAIISPLVSTIAYATGSDLPLKIWSVINPNLALQTYYTGTSGLFLAEGMWVPTFSEVILYLGAGYLIVAAIFTAAYLYFERRLGI